MNKSIIKAICVVIIFSMAVAGVIGYFALKSSTNYLQAEIQSKIVSASQSYAGGFNSGFNHIEGLTDSLTAYVETTFDTKAFKKAPDSYLKSYKKGLAVMIKKELTTIDEEHSLYVTFNPEYTKDNQEVWYVADRGNVKEIKADFVKNKRNFTRPYKDDMAYFFEPQGKTGGVWSGRYYEKDIKEDVFSYSRAIYLNGIFIGVAGADIVAKDMVDTIENKKIYEKGQSALLTGDCKFIISSAMGDGEKTAIADCLKKGKKALSKGGASLNYRSGGDDKIMGCAVMDNGWIFVITQPKSEAYASIKALSHMLIALAVTLGIALIAFLIVFSRPFIKKQTMLEEANREKEIIMVYQSRQAKIGEMVGNIAHQWKQPLNTINLILANLLDSYRYGDLDEEKLSKSLAKVEMTINKLSGTISDFSDFLKPSKEKKAFFVGECIDNAVTLMEESIHNNKIKIKKRYIGACVGFGYPNEMTHAVFNILNNARDAIEEASPDIREITVTVKRKGDMLELRIANRGAQMAEEIRQHAFEPYYSTKAPDKGTGLGLYFSKQIIQDRMGGSIRLINLPDGVCCIICIPVAGGRKDVS